MKHIEKRLRALEVRANYKSPKPPRRVIVSVGESLETVLTREGIEPGHGPGIAVVVRRIIAPKVTEGDLATPADSGA